MLRAPNLSKRDFFFFPHQKHAGLPRDWRRLGLEAEYHESMKVRGSQHCILLWVKGIDLRTAGIKKCLFLRFQFWLRNSTPILTFFSQHVLSIWAIACSRCFRICKQNGNTNSTLTINWSLYDKYINTQ